MKQSRWLLNVYITFCSLRKLQREIRRRARTYPEEMKERQESIESEKQRLLLNCNRLTPSWKGTFTKIDSDKNGGKGIFQYFFFRFFCMLLPLSLRRTFFLRAALAATTLQPCEPYWYVCNAAPSVEICFSNFLTCLPFPRSSLSFFHTLGVPLQLVVYFRFLSRGPISIYSSISLKPSLTDRSGLCMLRLWQN